MDASTSRQTRPKPPRRIKQTSQSAARAENLQERIAKRAYEIYEERIRQDALSDWLQAEREILA
jgi:hypothetical protein